MFRAFTKKKPRNHKKIHKLSLESLEARRLMAADLGVVDEGLRSEFLSALQAEVNTHALSVEAPLVGGQLAESNPGQVLTPLAERMQRMELSEGVSIAQVKSAIQSAAGDMLLGDIVAKGSDGDDEIRFQMTFGANQRFDRALALDLGLGDQSIVDVLLRNDEAVDVNVEWKLDLEFGVRDDQFFVVTSNSDELSFQVDASLDENFAGGLGRMGVFVADFDAGAEDSFYSGLYTIDILGATNGFLNQADLGNVTADGTLVGSGQINLSAYGEFLSDGDSGSRDKLINLGVTTDLTIDYDFSIDTNTSVVADTASQITYENVGLDLGKFYRTFIDPLIEKTQNVLQPLDGTLDFLTEPIPGLSDFSEMTGMGQLTVLDAARSAYVMRGDSRGVAQVERAQAVIRTVNAIRNYRSPSSAESADMGAWSVEYGRSFEIEFKNDKEGDQDKKKVGTPDVEGEKKELKEKGENGEAKRTEPKDERAWATSQSISAQFNRDLALPILTEPLSVYNLLTGNPDATLFTADLDFEIEFSFDATYPIFPGLLNAEVGLNVGTTLDIDIGYDALGVKMLTDSLDFSSEETLAESMKSNRRFLAEGFFLDDHNPNGIIDGTKVSSLNIKDNSDWENPEFTLTAGLSLGASIGPDLKVLEFKAGVEGYLDANLLFDLNDMPNTLPTSEWKDLDNPEYPADTADWVYDGRVRMGEFSEIAMADPRGLFNASGEFVVGLNAFAKASLLGLEIVNLEHRVAEGTIFNKNFYQLSDQQIIDGQKLGNAQLARLGTDGTLYLYAGETGSQRSGVVSSGTDGVVDERFVIRHTGGTIEGGDSVNVEFYDANDPSIFAVQSFYGVKKIVAVGGDGDDSFVVYGRGMTADVNFEGGAGNDQLSYEGRGEARLNGGKGHDQLFGGRAADRLIGGSGNDYIHGRGGNDDIRGGSGNDRLYGGSGNDRIYGQTGSDRLYGGIGDDMLAGDQDKVVDLILGGGNDFLFGESGEDELWGGPGNDYMDGGSQDDKLRGEADDDTLRGGSGNDDLHGDAHFVVDLYSGNDTLYGDSGNDKLSGGNGADTMHGGDGDDTMWGGAGNDTMYGDAGNDWMRGQAGNDFMRGGSGNDDMHGDARFIVELHNGADRLYGDDGNDTLAGGNGNDVLYGGNGNDYMTGSWGNDIMYGNAGHDRMYGQMGNDSLRGGSGNDYVHGGWGNDSLRGEDGHDRIYGDLGNDWMSGGNHNDYMNGGAGADTMYGDAGNDTLFGGRIGILRDYARDYLHGGSGRDTIYIDRIWAWSRWRFVWKWTDTVRSGERYIYKNFWV